MNKTASGLFCVAVFALSGCAGLVHDMRDVVDVSGVVKVKGKNASLAIYFSDEDRHHIMQYYKGKKGKKTPPGLAKKRKLPRGLHKQIKKNGQLPPGLQGRGLPGDLNGRLSSPPEGYVRLVIEHDIVLMNKKTGIVADVMVGIVF